MGNRLLQHGGSLPSLIATAAGSNASGQPNGFAPLVPKCLRSNEWSGPSVLAHYLDGEPDPAPQGAASAQIRLACLAFGVALKNTGRSNRRCCCSKTVVTPTILVTFVQVCMIIRHFGDTWFSPHGKF